MGSTSGSSITLFSMFNEYSPIAGKLLKVTSFMSTVSHTKTWFILIGLISVTNEADWLDCISSTL